MSWSEIERRWASIKPDMKEEQVTKRLGWPVSVKFIGTTSVTGELVSEAEYIYYADIVGKVTYRGQGTRTRVWKIAPPEPGKEH